MMDVENVYFLDLTKDERSGPKKSPIQQTSGPDSWIWTAMPLRILDISF
jgi:hypothetical protein